MVMEGDGEGGREGREGGGEREWRRTITRSRCRASTSNSRPAHLVTFPVRFAPRVNVGIIDLVTVLDASPTIRFASQHAR